MPYRVNPLRIIGFKFTPCKQVEPAQVNPEVTDARRLHPLGWEGVSQFEVFQSDVVGTPHPVAVIVRIILIAAIGNTGVFTAGSIDTPPFFVELMQVITDGARLIATY